MAKKKEVPKIATGDLLERIMKTTELEFAARLDKSTVFKKSRFSLDVPALNCAASGSLREGLQSGVTVIAGKSKTFKTAYSLMSAAAFLRENPDGLILFYDNEFGSPASYFRRFKIPPERVVHLPITNLEELTFDLVAQLEHLTRKDKVFILIDSIGNTASKNEVVNALKHNESQDMTRSKAIKSLIRMITSKLHIKDVPLVMITHTYDPIAKPGQSQKQAASGGTGPYYSADSIWFVSRRVFAKEANKAGGYDRPNAFDFVITIEKSRFVREGSKFPIRVTYAGGAEKYSGLFDMALEHGYIASPSQGWYAMVDLDTGEVLKGKKFQRSSVEFSEEFWEPILASDQFNDMIISKYSLDAAMSGQEPIVLEDSEFEEEFAED